MQHFFMYLCVLLTDITHVMKRHTAVIFILLLVVSCTSCKKMGKYNPGKKISKIYCENEDSNKYLSQVWKWNNDKLDRIDHYTSAGNWSYSESFSYTNKGFIDRITSGTAYTQFSYDDTQLIKAQCYSNGELVEEFDFSYTLGKITKITETYYSNSKSKQDVPNFSPLQLILPESTCKRLKDFQVKQSNSKGIQTYSYEIAWWLWEKNIARIRTIYENEAYEITYEYDNKKNPTLNLLTLSVINDGTEYYSRNNIVEETYWEYEYIGSTTSYGRTATYSYTYEGNWPISQRYHEPIDGYWYANYYEYGE